MEDRSKGIILILLSALFFALMAATVKSLKTIPVPEKIFFRNLLGLFIATFMVMKKKEPLLGNNKKLLFLRGGLGLLGVVTYFFAISRIHLADAVILNKTSPFFVLVLSYVFLKEKIKKLQIISLILGLIGAILVIKPTLDVSMIPYLSGLLSAFFAGSAYTIIRHLRHTDSTETIVLYFTGISTITMIPLMIFGQFVIPTMMDMIKLFGLGIFATTAQFFMTSAYRFAPAGELVIYTYTNIIFSAGIGLVIWSEIPDILSIIGGGFIIGAGFVNYYSNRKTNIV